MHESPGTVARRLLDFRPGYQIICVPCEWKLKDTPEASPDEICLHVAQETFGQSVELVWDDEDPGVVDEALTLLRNDCQAAGRTIELANPFECVIRLGSVEGGSAGLRWVRVVKVPEGTETEEALRELQELWKDDYDQANE
jgi:hypothetical protein